MQPCPTRSCANPGPLVLVVDDDQEVRTCLEMVLEDGGYTVSAAPNGVMALELAQRDPPAAIVLDYQMPVLDGAGFVHAYRSLPGPHAPIILLTASCYAPTRAAELGVASYLDKPFNLDALLAQVQGCIDHSRSGIDQAGTAGGAALASTVMLANAAGAAHMIRTVDTRGNGA